MKKIVLILMVLAFICGCKQVKPQAYDCFVTIENFTIVHHIEAKEDFVETITLTLSIDDRQFDFDFTTIEEVHKQEIIKNVTSKMQTYFNHDDLSFVPVFEDHVLTLTKTLSIDKHLDIIQSLYSKEITNQSDIRALVKGLEQQYYCEIANTK